MSDVIRVSTSALNEYLKCGEKYRRRYIEKDWRPGGFRMHIGTAAHEAARVLHRRQIVEKEKTGIGGLTWKDADKEKASLLGEVLDATQMARDEAADTAATKFDEAVKEKGVALEEDEKGDEAAARGAAKDAAVDHATYYASAIGRTINPISIERAIEVHPPGIVMKGVIDLIDGTLEGEEVVDRKTGSKKPQENQHGNIQLSFYAALRLKETGSLPPNLRLEHTLRTPKRGEMSSVTQNTTRTTHDVKELLWRIEQAVKGIRAGVFMPADPAQWWCSAKFCEFYGECKYTLGRRSH